MNSLRIENSPKVRVLWLMLGSRLILFLLFQFFVALYLNSWQASQKHWLLTATLTNLVSIALLFNLFKKEGKSYFNIFRFSSTSIKKDILVFIGILLIVGPVAFIPNYYLSIWFWGNVEIPFKMMFQPIEAWLLYILLLLFPITIVFAELATYFGYIMPRLENQLNKKWVSVCLPVLFLSMQHCTLPFIPDYKFIIYRGLVFLPFALLLGISIWFRPKLFPYFAILHGIMDFGTAIMFMKL